MPSYFVRDSLFDSAESSLYRALSLVVCQRALLFTKIRLGELIANLESGSEAAEADELADRRVDFVLCDRNTVQPIAIILLEEEGARGDYLQESEKLGQMCMSVGLPLVWLPRQNSYLMQQLTPVVEPLLLGSTVRNDFNNGDRVMIHALRNGSKVLRKQPAYPGYGALKTIAGKLS